MTELEISDVYRQYGHLVARRCKRIVGHADRAEDALQEVFLRVWRYGEGFRGAESKVAWLYRVADRCCFDLIALDRKRREVSIDAGHEPIAGGSESHRVEDGEIVIRFLERFDDRLKQVAVLHYLDGMTQEEIAVATGWSRQTVIKKLAFLAERAEKLRATLLAPSPETKASP